METFGSGFLTAIEKGLEVSTNPIYISLSEKKQLETKDDPTVASLTEENQLPTINKDNETVKSFVLPLDFPSGADKTFETLMAFPRTESSNRSIVSLSPLLIAKPKQASHNSKKLLDGYPYAFWLYCEGSRLTPKFYVQQISLHQEMPKVVIENDERDGLIWGHLKEGDETPINLQIEYSSRFELIMKRNGLGDKIPSFEIYKFNYGSFSKMYSTFKGDSDGFYTTHYDDKELICDKNFSSILILSKNNLFPESKLAVKVESKKDRLAINLRLDNEIPFIKWLETEHTYKEIITTKLTVSIYRLIEEDSKETVTEGMKALIQTISSNSKVHQCKLSKVQGAELIKSPPRKHFYCIKPNQAGLFSLNIGDSKTPECDLVYFILKATNVLPEAKAVTQDGVTFYMQYKQNGSQFCTDYSSVYYVKFDFNDESNSKETTSAITLGSFYGSHEATERIRI